MENTGANFSSRAIVKDRNCGTLAITSDQFQKWAEYFHAILNIQEPRETLPVNRGHRHRLHIFKIGDKPYEKINRAIRQTKNNNTLGEGQITLEMPKADTQISAKRLFALFDKL